jgi:site-specific DNA-methyltransferase (adenine-specific)
MIPKIIIGQAIIYAGNNLDILPELASNSVDSIVCDPPYELGFMGKSWDNSGIAYSVELWQQCLRVLKPGGHLLAFGGTRTWHRLAVAIEDAGFEIRDNIAWLYGSGFPKSHNISKAIDKLHGAEREVIGTKITGNARTQEGWAGGQILINETISATDDAKAWEGWGTALKPAHEPIVVARKPVVGTVAENVLKYGTGGLNIDASRIGTEDKFGGGAKGASGFAANYAGEGWSAGNDLGRWPANIIFDETTAELLDEQSGIRPGGQFPSKRGQAVNTSFASGQETIGGARSMGDSGGASRFFYVAKANKKDRNEGLDELPIQRPDLRTTTGMGTFDEKGVQPQRNFHPTVKPTSLMQYLIRLVTPENGTVLDPFAGSGSTGKAAILEGKRFIGIELTAEYLPIIEGRLRHAYLTLDDKEAELFE